MLSGNECSNLLFLTTLTINVEKCEASWIGRAKIELQSRSGVSGAALQKAVIKFQAFVTVTT